jgi:hypothetical protein
LEPLSFGPAVPQTKTGARQPIIRQAGDDALIDTYHQAAEDHKAAQTEGSDNLSKAHAQMLAAEKAMQARFSDYRTRYKMRYR